MRFTCINLHHKKRIVYSNLLFAIRYTAPMAFTIFPLPFAAILQLPAGEAGADL